VFVDVCCFLWTLDFVNDDYVMHDFLKRVRDK
jgi:hypothetical protein